MIVFDKQNGRLVQFQKKATPDFWDAQWSSFDLKKAVQSSGGNRLVNAITRKYLPAGSRVLEGGCGIGTTVHGLDRLGYDVYGVDTAKQTVDEIREHFPRLNVSVQDVRNLTFLNDSFDGCWSIGVIEHFWDGYEDILKEANRILRPGGYLFLIFPFMSPLRKLKASFGLYEGYNNSMMTGSFYQFMLDPKRVKTELKSLGFTICSEKNLDGTKGLKDEVSCIKPILQPIYNSKKLFGKAINYGVSTLCSPLSGHSVLFVCQKIRSLDKQL